MWSEFWIIFGVVCWMAGFIQVGSLRQGGSSFNRAMIRPPSWIYLACGRPASPRVPRGVMALRAFIAQLEGIFFVAYGIIYRLFSDPNLILQSFLLFVGVNLIFLLGIVLYNRYPYMGD